MHTGWWRNSHHKDNVRKAWEARNQKAIDRAIRKDNLWCIVFGIEVFVGSAATLFIVIKLISWIAK